MRRDASCRRVRQRPSTRVACRSRGSAWRDRIRWSSRFESANIPGELDDHRLHAEADAEVGNFVFAGEANRVDHAFDAAFAKSAGNKNPIVIAQAIYALRPAQFLGFNPVDIRLSRS